MNFVIKTNSKSNFVLPIFVFPLNKNQDSQLLVNKI